MSLSLTITETIKVLQDRKGISNDEMAKVIGITAQNYNRRMRLNTITTEELEKLLEKLGCRIEIIEKTI